MITAFVMLNVERGAVSSTAEDLLKVKGVTEVYSVTGEFDLIAVIRVKNPDEVADVVTEHLHNVKGIVGSDTHVAFKHYSQHDLEAAFSLGGDSA